MEAKENYLIQLAEKHLINAKRPDNQNSIIDFRISTFAIINFYNILMLDAGIELGREIKESFNFERKIFIISQEFPEILTTHRKLLKSIEDLRNKLSHTDVSIPEEKDLSQAVEKAKEFRNYLKGLIIHRKSTHKKILTLKEEYELKIRFIKLWFDVPFVDEDFSKNFEKQSLKIKKIYDKLELFEKINIEKLDDKSIQTLINILNITLEEAELILEDIYGSCPECQGKIIETSEETTHYTGPYDDPEPDSYTVWRVIKCDKCGKIFEKEHITTESI